MNKRIDPSSWTWFNEPKLYIFSGDKLILETEPETNMDSCLLDKVSAFGLLGEKISHISFEARIDFMFESFFDECGLIVKFTKEDWWKYGIRSKSESANEIFCEHSFKGYLDGSYRSIGKKIQNLYFQIKTCDNFLNFSCSTDGINFKVMRRVAFGDKIITIPGIYACSPGKSYFDCTFSKIETGGYYEN